MFTPRGKFLREQKRRELAARYPGARRLALAPVPPVGKRKLPAGPRLVLGRDKNGEVFAIPEQNRSTHQVIFGSPGSGKSVLMANGVREDILSGAGTILLDPHSHAPDSVLSRTARWLAESGEANHRTVHLIDPSADRTCGFNPLHCPDTDPSVVANAMLEAIERGFGDENTLEKPTMRRALRALFTACAELNFTLLEAEELLDPADATGIRAYALAKLQDERARAFLKRLNELAANPRLRDTLEIEVTGPRNRLEEFLSSRAIRRVFGQQGTIDIAGAMDRGEVILAALGGSNRVYEREADLLGRMILRAILFAAKRRRNRRPCHVWVDEAPRLLSGDVPQLFEEARKEAISLSLALQTISQAGKPNDRLRESILTVPQTRIIFRMNSIEEAKLIAPEVVKLNLELPVAALNKPAVVGYELRRMKNASAAVGRSSAQSHSDTHSNARTVTEGQSKGGSIGVTKTKGTNRSTTYGSSHAVSDGTSETDSYSETTGISNTRSSSSTVGGGSSESTSHSDGTSYADSSDRGVSLSNTTEPFTNRWDDRTDSRGAGRSDGGSSSDAVGSSSSENWSESEGQAHTDSHAETEGHASATSHSVTETSSESQTEGTSESTAKSRGRTWSASTSTASTTSTARSLGSTEGTNSQLSAGYSEALVPVMAELPTAVHSLGNMMHFASEAINSLPTGVAIVKAMIGRQIEKALITVPFTPLPSEADPGAARRYLLERTPSARPIEEVDQSIAARRANLCEQAIKLSRPAVDVEPKGFRVSGERWANNPQRKGAKPPTKSQIQTTPEPQPCEDKSDGR